jgi:hypothetical protein
MKMTSLCRSVLEQQDCGEHPAISLKAKLECTGKGIIQV